MKNFSKTIAAISMSLMTVGAMAQESHVYAGSNPKPRIIVQPVQKGTYIQGASKSNNVHNVNSQTFDAQINYPFADYTYFVTLLAENYQGSAANNGWGASLVNSAYIKTDTGATKGDKNYDLLQSVTVAYDSLADIYTQTILPSNATTIKTIDTVWALVSYKNTTHTAGYIIFKGLNTGAGGYPGNTVLFTDTVKVGTSITQDTSLGKYFGDSLDRGYYVAVLPNYNLNGKSFAINVTYVGSKSDSLELFYGYPYFQCGQINYPKQSAMGVNVNGLKYVNTFVTGYPLAFAGVPTLSPETNGTHIWYGIQCSDTSSYAQEDAGIFAAFTYTSSLGINNISASGLSLDQNYPNPFNRETTINYSLTNSANITFTVNDITGRTITTTNYGIVTPGQHQITLSANTFSPGIYFYSFNVNGSVVTKKMVVTQ